MKHKTAVAFALAAILASAPLAACAEEAESVPPELSAPLPEEDEKEPVAGETEEPEQTEPPEPEIPEEPENPAESEPEHVEPEPEPTTKSKYISVHTNGLNVRTGAGTNYTSLGTVESGVLLKYAGKTGSWYKTCFKGRTAYVSANEKYTSLALLEEGERRVESVIEEGLRLLGVPYVYGAVRLHDGSGVFLKGFTEQKFDCSSLMQYIFYQGAGVLLNTTTRTQVKQGRAVARADVRRGDLLFFTNSSRYHNTGIERVGHVALYLGDNYILHTASDYAKVEQISAKRWSYYLTARRVL